MDGDFLKEAEVNMNRIPGSKFFCGYIGMTGQVGSLGNDIGETRVGEFGDRLFNCCVYPKSGHLENTLIRGMANRWCKI